jgi:hypothetical protein
MIKIDLSNLKSSQKEEIMHSENMFFIWEILPEKMINNDLNFLQNFVR